MTDFTDHKTSETSTKNFHILFFLYSYKIIKFQLSLVFFSHMILGSS